MAAKATENVILAQDASDAATVAAGREAWSRIRRTQTSFDDWVAVARAAAVGRAHCLKVAATDKPVGSRYNREVGKWLRASGLDGISAQERYRALQMLDNLEAVQSFRAGLPETARRKLNCPSRVMRHFQAANRAFCEDAACRHAPAREHSIFPAHCKEGARRRIIRTLEIYGPDPHRLAEAALGGGLPHPEDIEQLLDYQAPHRRGRPPIKTRPRSPSAVVADTAALSLRP